MNYSDEVNNVRVDIWKESGKWYTTISLVWIEYHDGILNELFKEYLDKQYPRSFKGMKATCLEPYHRNGHPISVTI